MIIIMECFLYVVTHQNGKMLGLSLEYRVIMISQGSVVTQTVLGGLTILFNNNVQLIFWATLYIGDWGKDGTAGKFCLYPH